MMKIKAIRFANFRKISNGQDREVKGLIIAVALFASGMILGSGFWKSGIDTDFFVQLFNNYIEQRLTKTFLNLYVHTFFFNSVFILFILIMGLSSVGCVFLPPVPFVRGLGYGILSGYLLSEHLMTGIGYYLLTVFPSAVIMNVVIILSCNNASFLSADIIAVLLAKKQPEEKQINNYIRISIIYWLLVVIFSLADCVFVKSFTVLFKF